MQTNPLKKLFSGEFSLESWQRTLFILFVAQLMTAVGFSSIFPFLPLYVKDLGSTTNLSVEFLSGMVYSAQAFTMMLASPIWGALADRFGRKLMVERSMFGGTVILLLMAFARSGEELVLLRAIQGFITGTVAATSAMVASIAPRQRTGFAMGLLSTGLGSGVALGPLIGGVLADNFGYAAAFYVTAALLFISGLLVLFGVKEEFTPPPRSARGMTHELLSEWRQILKTSGVVMTYGLRFASQLGRNMIVPILPLLMELLLKDGRQLNTFTGLVIGSASATTTLSAVYLGRLGDRIGHRKIVIGSTILAFLIYLPHYFVTSGWQLLILQALAGVTMGGVIPSISALLAGYTKEGEEGAVYGLDNSINAGGRAVAPMLGGAVAIWFGMRSTFLFTGLFFLAAGLMAARWLPNTRTSEELVPINEQEL